MTVALLLLSVLGLLMAVLWLTLIIIPVVRRARVRRELAKDRIPMTLERQRYLHDEFHRQQRDVDQV